MSRKSRSKKKKKPKKKEPGPAVEARSEPARERKPEFSSILLEGYKKIKGFRPSLSWLERSDILAAALYFAVMFIVELPAIERGFDTEHHTTLLINSMHVRDGWIPFKDFYPWYGPLYYYLLGPLIWMTGTNILSVKLFLDVFSPLISMAMFILSLRALRIPWQGRLFAVAACATWGVDRLFHCGSTRSILGLLLIAIWVKISNTPRASWLRSIMFPSILIGIFYSPEVGLYLIPPAMVIAFMDILNLPSSERIKSLLYYAIGAISAVTLLAVLYFGTAFAKGYLDFMTYASENTHWAYGRPLPNLPFILGNTYKILFYVPIIVIIASGIKLFIQIKNDGLKSIPAWIPACILYGGLLYATVYLRAQDDHLLFALPPILALMSIFFQMPVRFGLLKVAMIALFIWGMPFFINSYFNTAYWKLQFNPKLKWVDTEKFMGVYDRAVRVKMVKDIKKFCDAHPDDTILFPLHGFEALRVGRPFLWSFDDLFWVNMPSRREKLFKQFNNINPDYIFLDLKYRTWVYMHEDTDALFDLILSRYLPVKNIGSTLIYKRAPEPRVPASMAKSLPGPFTLDDGNEFSVKWKVPPGLGQGYVQMNEKFNYRLNFLRRFTIPFVFVLVDGKTQDWKKLGHGRIRIRTSPEGGTFRFYLPENAKEVEMVISFWGLFNARPNNVELTDVRFYRFNFKPLIPYTDKFLKEGF